MTFQSTFFGIAAVAALAVPAPAAAACAPARVGPGVASLPEPWRRAVAELVQESATEGRPWSCGGGVVDLVAREGGATLTIVTGDGRVIAREVSAPDEVVPLGEALLARPLLPPAPPPPPAPEVPPPPAPPAEPRVLLSALLGPRYAGSSNLLWGGVTAAASVPIGAWGVGAWGRFDGPMVVFGGRRPAVREVCVGASASRSFALRRLDLRASVVPSVAVVTRTGDGPEETRVDGRVGLEARGALAITSVVRAVAAIDVELSPRGLAEGRRREHGGPPPSAFPSYTVGLGLGVEVAIR